MRVALVAPLFESVPPRLYGGTERVIDSLCHGLERAGIEVTLFASGDSTAPGHRVPVIDEALRLRRSPARDPNAFNLKLLAEVAQRASRFDVIHNHHDYWMLPLTRMTRTPLLTTLHGRLDLTDIDAAFEAYPDVRYVSISDSQRLPMPGLDWVRTIHHGLDLRQFPFYPRAGKYLAFLGRISPEKRPEWAIEIALAAGIPLKIAAKIEGRESRDYFESRVRPRLDGRNVEFVGEISETEKCGFLGNALGLVFPIDWPEPFGLVMIESLACGTPVLARPCGAAAEILADGKTGFSSLSLAELARRARDLAALDRRECRRWVESRFTLERMTEDYIHVYEGIRDRDRRDLLHPVQRLAHRNP